VRGKQEVARDKPGCSGDSAGLSRATLCYVPEVALVSLQEFCMDSSGLAQTAMADPSEGINEGFLSNDCSAPSLHLLS
jgi:hypothetical protein